MNVSSYDTGVKAILSDFSAFVKSYEITNVYWCGPMN